MLTTYTPKFLIFRITAIMLLVCCLSSCEKVLNSKLATAPTTNVQVFNSTEGLELPYALYMPSSMIGWELSDATQLHFDKIHKMYVLDNIPINKPLIDDGGRRFKLCSAAWRHQFGFGLNLTDAESTFGIPNAEVVLQVAHFTQAATDLHIELPKQIFSSTKNLSTQQYQYMRIEFKLVSWEPTTKALLHVTLH